MRCGRHKHGAPRFFKDVHDDTPRRWKMEMGQTQFKGRHAKLPAAVTQRLATVTHDQVANGMSYQTFYKRLLTQDGIELVASIWWTTIVSSLSPSSNVESSLIFGCVALFSKS